MEFEPEYTSRISEQKLQYLAHQFLAAEELEKKRIAAVLHDEIGQSMLVLKLWLSSARDRLGAERETLYRDTTQWLYHLDMLIEGVRRLSSELSPTVVEDLGLSSALKHLLGEFCCRHEVDLHSTGFHALDDLFPQDSCLWIYRAFQCALMNICNHGHGSCIWAIASISDDRVTFILENSGKECDPQEAPARVPSEGDLQFCVLDGRVRLLGGVLTMETSKGSGTSVSFSIPLSREFGPDWTPRK